MVALPARAERAAHDAAETICREHGIKPDVHLETEVSDELMKRVIRDRRVALPDPLQ